jgi:vacuolar-type H+-ATPase subunit D/Vma8
MIKVGSRWEGTDKQFRVLAIVEHEGHIWIHYREDLGIKVPVLECREYSCYEESFLARFRPLPE